jgi:hypothetical protein
MMQILQRLVLAAVLLASLAACESQEQPTAPSAEQLAAAKAQMEAKAEQHFALYDQMIKADNAELALPLAEELLAMYPQSAAAARVGPDIEALRERAHSEGESRRMSRLWSYQVAPMAGGTQSTASINSNADPKVAGEPVRLVLRRHTNGARVFSSTATSPGSPVASRVASPCISTMPSPSPLEGSIPPTGEPAIFIEEDKAFLKRMQAAKRVAIDVNEKGRAPRSLVFDVGGFSADKYQPLPKK